MAAGRMGRRFPGKQVQKGTESLAEMLGLDAARVPKGEAQIAHILDGKRADGEPLGREGLPAPHETASWSSMACLVSGGLPRRRTCACPGRTASGRGGAAAWPTMSQGLAASRARIGYVDLCWSADKSVSLAWAFAPTEAERNIPSPRHIGTQ